jgi:tetratricopeptide (TPR) repeat protein
MARPGANIPGPSTAINRGNIFAPRTDIATGDVGRRVTDFAGGWSGLSSAADDLKGLYDREYARDLLNRWPWWSGGYGNSGSSGYGYSNPYSSSDSVYGNPYSTEATEGNDSSANAESQERNDSESNSKSSKEDAANSDNETTAAKQCMEKAVLVFQKGDYAGAQNQCEQAIRLAPGDANVHEFRALCQFAQVKYTDAAAALYAVLADGPGWDWKTLSSFYSSATTYTKQLRALEEYVKEHPKDAAGRFVLAYHYLVLDERDAALSQLREVVKLQPKDKVSAGIVKVLEKAKDGK